MKGEENENIWYHMDPSNKEHASVLTFVNSFLLSCPWNQKAHHIPTKDLYVLQKEKKIKKHKSLMAS